MEGHDRGDSELGDSLSELVEWKSPSALCSRSRPDSPSSCEQISQARKKKSDRSENKKSRQNLLFFGQAGPPGGPRHPRLPSEERLHQLTLHHSRTCQALCNVLEGWRTRHLLITPHCTSPRPSAHDLTSPHLPPPHCNSPHPNTSKYTTLGGHFGQEKGGVQTRAGLQHDGS